MIKDEIISITAEQVVEFRKLRCVGHDRRIEIKMALSLLAQTHI